jgi:hypothetical protein
MLCIGCPNGALQQEVVVLEVSGCNRQLINRTLGRYPDIGDGGAVGGTEADLSAHDTAPCYAIR